MKKSESSSRCGAKRGPNVFAKQLLGFAYFCNLLISNHLQKYTKV